MRVLRPAPITVDWTAEVTCPSCTALLEVAESDLQVASFGGHPVAVYAECPTPGCGHGLSTEAPYDVKHRVVERWKAERAAKPAAEVVLQ